MWQARPVCGDERHEAQLRCATCECCLQPRPVSDYRRVSNPCSNHCSRAAPPCRTSQRAAHPGRPQPRRFLWLDKCKALARPARAGGGALRLPACLRPRLPLEDVDMGLTPFPTVNQSINQSVTFKVHCAPVHICTLVSPVQSELEVEDAVMDLILGPSGGCCVTQQLQGRAGMGRGSNSWHPLQERAPQRHPTVLPGLSNAAAWLLLRWGRRHHRSHTPNCHRRRA